MRVRLATFADMSDIVALASRVLGKGSTYDGIPFNAVVARRTVKRSLTNPDARVWVADDGGRIRGFLIGEIGEMPMSHYCSATDLAFVAEAGGQQLIEAFRQWCVLRKCARIDMGVSASTPREGIDRLFRRAGFQQAGGMFYLNLIHEPKSEVA